MSRFAELAEKVSDICDEAVRLKAENMRLQKVKNDLIGELAAYREIGEVKKIAEMIKAADAMHHRIATRPLTNPINTIYEEWKRLGAAVIALRKPSPQPVALSAEEASTVKAALEILERFK
ncbi:hypothetical protein M0R72_10730 [Candidatus Pacearchaeota archaeon]|jgi:hypothetical protein|nr:hypothetical protein [Candidatus Pacearchaeota archaeon]